MNLRKIGCIIIVMMILIAPVSAQVNPSDTSRIFNDTLIAGTVRIVEKDSRIDILGKKMAEYNEALASRPSGVKMVRGYRLMVLSTPDRNNAMTVRSKLLRMYPDQKVYMTFQSPYIKLKFGNFAEKAEAERYRKQLDNSEIVKNNIYLVNEMIELKFDKNAPAEQE
jgi:hypothetical protein